MRWEKIALIGVGLLGGSLGLALRQRRLAGVVAGYVRRQAAVAECTRLGVVDRASTRLDEVVRDADLVILCTPLAQMRGLLEDLLPHTKPGTLITDVGSVKGSLVSELEPLAEAVGAVFLGSHPMAGAEKNGMGAARFDLFQDAICVVTPTAKSPAKAVRCLEDFWKSVGGQVLKLPPDLHDDLVSRSSHLPHVVAAELANYVLSPVHPKEQALLCANGFRDTTRIASGSAEMWRDIVLANRRNLMRVLGVFIEDLQEFCEALKHQDGKVVEEFFEKARQRREQWRARGNRSGLE